MTDEENLTFRDEPFGTVLNVTTGYPDGVIFGAHRDDDLGAGVLVSNDDLETLVKALQKHLDEVKA